MTTFERLDDRINMLRPDLNKPECLLKDDTGAPNGLVGFYAAEEAIRRAYAQGRKDAQRETAALLRGIMAV